MTEKIHKFEEAGLGKAPFQVVGVNEERGPKVTYIDGIRCESGAPGQPVGTCDYCGTGIADCYEIRSSDGREFVVGSDCVAKTGDAGLKTKVDQLKRKLNIQKQDQKIAENWKWYQDHITELAGIQYGRYTLAQSIEWYYKNAGRSGKIKIIRTAKKLLEEKS